ncbi:hypothetical protein F4779DRAFT_624053 [Xylariaceae sp. FL0662B]|nr:hypothetical protein F4779DRAFT_624053 [Xylariaceae sp. FL0662B]
MSVSSLGSYAHQFTSDVVQSDQLEGLVGKFGSMSIRDMTKGLAGILAEGILSSAQGVMDALLGVLHKLASSAINIRDSKVHVPIISDILIAIRVPDISFLGLFTWIAVVGYTAVYKIVKDEPPFPENESVDDIISAAEGLLELSRLFAFAQFLAILIGDPLTDQASFGPAPSCSSLTRYSLVFAPGSINLSSARESSLAFSPVVSTRRLFSSSAIASSGSESHTGMSFTSTESRLGGIVYPVILTSLLENPST